ncbi:MAG TPA: efflux RND transporter periplasmic adaptor subunit [Candidatus Baltobacteraceae bacterium]|nr:efflux RND transporter periplasmic adaptor subunit [Candidatus Baltobacteraceae bacterium]
MSQKQQSILDLSLLSSSLLAEQEVAPRARVLAHFVADFLPGSAISVYTLAADADATYWAPQATFGDANVRDHAIASDSGLLAQLIDDPSPILRSAAALSREDYPHIDIRRTLRSLCYLPLVKDETLLGAIEILSFDAGLAEETIDALQPAAQLAAAAIAAAQSYEEERHATLTSITRITQLYDLEKVFSSTLEMSELLPLIASKFLEILGAQAVNIWLLHPDETLELMHQSGEDPSSFAGQLVKPNEGVVGVVSDNGESVCISDPADPRLAQRNAALDEPFVHTLLAAPVIDRGSLVGVVEIVNKADGSAFSEDDLFALTNLNDTASNALHNASLLTAERKVEILETLNTVSHEITSTLNLERMLQTIVNAPQAVIPYSRAALALERHGRFKLSAVTGFTKVDADSPDLAPLNEVLQWASLSSEIVHVRQHGDEIDVDREETRAKFRKYFEESGMRAFYAMPLNDDTGRVGMLALESTDPDFLSIAHIEILQVLASQATVALRNAQMYKEVPFISVLEPVLVRKRKFMAMEKRRRSLIIAGSIAALIFLVAVPLPLRVDGDAVVAPLRQAQIQPETPGVVSKVLVREGQPVRAGQVVAEMENWNAQSSVAEAQSKYQSALLQMDSALATNDGTAAGEQRVQAEYWKAELNRDQELLDKSQLRSPIDGVIATPHVEDFVGRKLGLGDSLAEVVDTSRAIVDVAADDEDAGLLRVGQRASVKLNSYPAHTFHGQVTIVSPKAEGTQQPPVFYSRVSIPNPDGAIRDGMEGRGKIRVGWRPAGYVFFRGPFFWAYSKLWYWFGW